MASLKTSPASTSADNADAAFGEPVRCKFGRDGVFKSAAEYKIFVYHQQVDEFKYFDRNCEMNSAKA